MTRLAALTGGTGFLGRHAIRALHEDGWRVRMLARRQPEAPELADIPIELILGDLSDDGALTALADGADAVIHIAGRVTAPSRAAFMAANAEGAARMAAAWRAAAPDARFALVSSMAARAPELSDYAASKRAGEAAVAGDGDLVILRPAAVYGAHDRESLKVLKLADMPAQPMLNAASARVAMIDARDAARAFAAFAAAPGLGGVFELTDAATGGHAWRDLAAAAAAALGRPARPVRVPAALLRLAGAAGEALAGLTGSAEMLTRGKAREILADWPGDPALRPPEALWRPEIPLETGLADMADWARRSGAL